MFKLTAAQKNLIRTNYAVGAIIALASFFVKKEFSFGVILGVSAGLLNFVLLERQIERFAANKKVHFILLGYISRYFLLGIIFYLSVKQSMVLFLGVLSGFFITQVLFFLAKIKNV